MIHELKTAPHFFEQVVSGEKTFEVLKSDRPFKVGDYLALNEYEKGAGDCGEYTGRCVLVRVIYELCDGQYCKEGTVILGFRPCLIYPQCEWDFSKNQIRIGLMVYDRDNWGAAT